MSNSTLLNKKAPVFALPDQDGKIRTLNRKSYEGIVRSTVVIDAKGKIVQHWSKVSGAESHPAEVAEFIATLA